MMRLRIQTPSRLHFGLLGWGPMSLRQFGGVGLMIEAPCIEVQAEPAVKWSFEGPLAERVSHLVDQIQRRIAREPFPIPNLLPARIKVVRTPSEHIGLGVGTQVSLAVTRMLLELSGVLAPSVETLARLSDRGLRSGIGLHGFHRGGLIVDGGRLGDGLPPPLLARTPFPEDWSILLVQPNGRPGWHGSDEVRAFASLPALPEAVADRLCRLTLLGILPAVIEHDLPTFGSALYELQQLVGEGFAAAQGGIYATPDSAAIIAEIMRLKMTGAGQSSWGPTLYAFGHLEEAEHMHVATRLSERFDIAPSAISWTKASNQGVVVQSLPPLT